MLILEPTIEFASYDWLKDESHPQIGTKEWVIFWNSFLESQGLKSIYLGSWFISVSSINDEIIRKIIALNLSENDLEISNLTSEEIEENLYYLTGGYALKNEDRILFEPQCCCDLRDIEEWEKITSETSEQWYNCLMGHALLHARKIENTIELKEIPESQIKSEINETVYLEDLKQAITKAKTEVLKFKQRVFLVAKELFNDEKIANSLVNKIIINE